MMDEQRWYGEARMTEDGTSRPGASVPPRPVVVVVAGVLCFAVSLLTIVGFTLTTIADRRGVPDTVGPLDGLTLGSRMMEVGYAIPVAVLAVFLLRGSGVARTILFVLNGLTTAFCLLTLDAAVEGWQAATGPTAAPDAVYRSAYVLVGLVKAALAAAAITALALPKTRAWFAAHSAAGSPGTVTDHRPPSTRRRPHHIGRTGDQGYADRPD